VGGRVVTQSSGTGRLTVAKPHVSSAPAGGPQQSGSHHQAGTVDRAPRTNKTTLLEWHQQPDSYEFGEVDDNG
jgi:tRNA(Phe) wybutosine-synthesizing methylase Tyw3